MPTSLVATSDNPGTEWSERAPRMCGIMCGMATRIKQSTVRRPSLPLTEADERDLDLLRTSPVYRRALDEVSPDASLADAGELTESALLHAVLEVGLATIRENALDAGYEELARQREGSQRRVSRRRRPDWADED